MKITGTSKEFRMSLTASNPELPSASCMSAGTSPERSLAHLECLIARSSHPDDAMAEFLHRTLEIEGYQSFVFEDEHVSGDLYGKLAACPFHQLVKNGQTNI